MSRTLGSLLHSGDKETVLNSFTNRMTHESVKRWPEASKRMLAGGFRMSLISDAEWLSSTTFAVRKTDRRLDEKSTYCEHDAYKFRTVLDC